MSTATAERMPDAPAPVRPAQDKPQVVEPRKAPGDIQKPKPEPTVQPTQPEPVSPGQPTQPNQPR
jgi:hypothetical protein